MSLADGVERECSGSVDLESGTWMLGGASKPNGFE